MNQRVCLQVLVGALMVTGVATVAPTSAHAETLSVAVEGLRSQNGHVLVAVHDKASSFPGRWQDATKTARLPAGRRPLTASFPGLRPGRYAVVVLHDEDGNGQMTMQPNGLPAEGFGASNNPPFLGSPTFAPAAVEVNGTTKISITLRYP